MPTLLASPPEQNVTVADLLRQLGDIPPARVRLTPSPGTATEQDLIALDGRDVLLELVDGTLVEKPVGFEEAFLASAIVVALTQFVRPRKLGWVVGADGMFRTVAKQVRLPDAAYLSRERAGGKRPRTAIAFLSPDLAVEVLSKSNTKAEMKRKRREYFEGGTRLVWVVDPVKRTVAVYTSAETPDAVLDENATLDGGAVLPGFAMELTSLFAVLDE